MKILYFNPGCALSLYKPYLEETILNFLNQHYGETKLHKLCCHHDPNLEPESVIINVCPGCDRRFGSLYEGISTISLWEVLDETNAFSFPDYHGLELSVHDACPVRQRPAVHQAVRSLLHKMNIHVLETEFFGTQSICCGDTYYNKIPLEQVHQKMKERASSMPCDEVCVYCVSCIKSMTIGGKKPRHLLDLLFGESTHPQTYDTEEWHKQVDEYIALH